ncbi:TetR/AcrR family transcriptional regulator [uncultured Corynebacterium sp.]|uniref:TetR/AcrR family transcriptional regulator n=1 Tax=uncultured Corynebacterium sp. TaxID=159447 RepID=UPI0025D19157|nr:TetR family transcriptional regulator [uncultured Corynebacterium sp.]
MSQPTQPIRHPFTEPDPAEPVDPTDPMSDPISAPTPAPTPQRASRNARPTRPLATLSQRLAKPVPSTVANPGRPQSFTNEDAVDAAYRAGLAGFSVKSVAKSIGVSPAALYQRFGTRRGLLNACLFRAFALVEPLEGAPDSDGTLRQFSDQWWALCLRCPDLEVVIRTYQDPEILLMTQRFTCYRDRLRQLGLSTEQATFAGSMIAVNLLQLRHQLPRTMVTPEDVPAAVDAQREQSIGFILQTLHSDWPEWSVNEGRR